MKMPTLPQLPESEKKPKAQKVSKQKAPKVAKIEPPEDSVGLRVVACGIAILCIVTACLYVNSTSMLTFLYIWGALTGSYVSYQFRRTKTFWLTFITSAGLLIVLGNFFEEIFIQYSAGKVQALVPFIHVLTGLQALHTFDLRAKSDINVSALIGLGLFACTAVLARDSMFAYITLGYIALAASLLYYEAVSRTQSMGAVGTSSERQEISELREASVKKKVSVGNAFLPLAMLPLLSILVFLALPRVESLFDLILNNVRRAQNGESLNINWVRAPNGVEGLGLITPSNAPGDANRPHAADGTSGTGAGGKKPGDKKGPGAGSKHGGKGSGAGGGNGLDGANLTNDGAAGPDGKGVEVPGIGGGTGEQGEGEGAEGGQTKHVKGAKPGKPGAKPGAKGAKGEKPPPPPPLDPGDVEKSAEEEDQSMVFRNRESAQHDNELLMRVMSSRDTYFRRVCFDKYDGHSWTISSLGKISKCSKHKAAYQELAGVPSLFVEPGMHSSQLTQEITVEANIGHLIPVAAIPQQLSYPKDPVFVDQFGAIRTKDPIKAGTHYRVVSQVPDYNVDEMRKASFDESRAQSLLKEYESYLELPADINPEVIKLAKSVAGTDGNWFAKAERICNYLRRNYKYSSELDEDDQREEIAYHFLFRTKEGACGPFTTAFCVMCRAAGLPSRSIGGFGPGEFNAGTGMHEIKNMHGHAWGEVFIPGYDWVPFDSTPTGLLPQPTPEDNSFMGNLRKGFEQIQDRFSNQTPPPPPLPGTGSDKSGTGGIDGAGKDGAGKEGGANGGPNNTDGSKQSGAGAGENNGTGGNAGSSGKSGKDGKNGAKSGSGSGKGAADKSGKSKKPGDKKESETKQEKSGFPNPFNKPLDWHEIVLLIIIVPAVMLLFQAIRNAVVQARKAKRAKSLEKPKPSTLLYLKVIDDLARVKVHRLPTDTPEDLMARFAEAEEMKLQTGVTFHPELEPLCKRFMELYIADRFGCDDATEMRATQLKKLSEQIHTLVRTKHHDN